MDLSPTYPEVGEQWCVCVGQHGVAGAQCGHVQVCSQGGGWVGQRLSQGVLLVVIR